MAGALRTAQEIIPDFALLQEVDVRADRSFKIDQAAQITEGFPGYAPVYASNFHSAYLVYPLHVPIGASQSGQLCLSRYTVSGAVRRSFPVDESFLAVFDEDDLPEG